MVLCVLKDAVGKHKECLSYTQLGRLAAVL